jgi:hypothetical protein
MPDHPAADTEAPELSEDDIRRLGRQRYRLQLIILALVTLAVSVPAASIALADLGQSRFVEARAIERLAPGGLVESGETASFSALLARPTDTVGLVLSVRPDGPSVTCGQPRAVDVAVRGTGVDGGAWRRTYSGVGYRFDTEVPVSRQARTISVDITPRGGVEGDSCRYETALVEAYAERDESGLPTWLSVSVALGCGGAATILFFRKRDVLRRPPWLDLATDTQLARARERAAEQAIEDALRRGRSPEPPPPPGDDEDLEPVGGPAATGGSDALVLADLWTVTHARLDKYHGIAQTQARRAFRNAQIAMGTGFVMLVGFTVLALIAENTATSIVAGALGASSAGLAGFIGRTFVRSQESTVETLRAYFTQPLEFSRYLAAERLVDGADLTREQRAEILGAIAQAIVAQPGAVPPDQQQPPNAPNGR